MNNNNIQFDTRQKSNKRKVNKENKDYNKVYKACLNNNQSIPCFLRDIMPFSSKKELEDIINCASELIKEKDSTTSQTSTPDSKKLMLSSPKITEMDHHQLVEIMGKKELPNATFVPPSIEEEQETTDYTDYYPKNVKTRVEYHEELRKNVNFQGSSTQREIGPQMFNVHTGFYRGFEVVANANAAQYILVEIPKRFYNNLSIKIGETTVLNQVNAGEILQDGSNYIGIFSIGYRSTRFNTRLTFTGTCEGFKGTFEFKSPVLDISCTEIVSQGSSKDFYKRNIVKMLLKVLPTDAAPATDDTATPTDYVVTRIIVMSSTVPTNLKPDRVFSLKIVASNGKSITISWGKGHYGEHLILCGNIVITSPLLLKKDLYRVEGYRGEKKEFEFFVNLYDNSISSSSSSSSSSVINSPSSDITTYDSPIDQSNQTSPEQSSDISMDPQEPMLSSSSSSSSVINSPSSDITTYGSPIDQSNQTSPGQSSDISMDAYEPMYYELEDVQQSPIINSSQQSNDIDPAQQPVVNNVDNPFLPMLLCSHQQSNDIYLAQQLLFNNFGHPLPFQNLLNSSQDSNESIGFSSPPSIDPHSWVLEEYQPSE